MRDDPVEIFNTLIKQVGKQWLMEELKKVPGRPGRKESKDVELLNRMGRLMAWHEDLPIRTAAREVAMRSTRKSHQWDAIIERTRKKFSDREKHHRRVGKISEVINLIIAIRYADSPDPISSCISASAPNKRTARVIAPDDDQLDLALEALRPKRPTFYAFPDLNYTVSEIL